MITFPEIAGVEVPILLLVFIGFTVGIVGGFIGVGGGYMVTPALIVMGFPASFAVGTDTMHIAGKSIIATLRHSQLGNVDLKLGALMAIGSVAGAEGGVRLINWLKDHGIDEQVVLTASLCLMATVAVMTYLETMAAKRQMDELKAAGKTVGRDMQATGFAQKLQFIRVRPLVRLPTSRVTVSVWTVLVIGVFTGFLSGFFGVGGGFLRVPAMIYLLGVPSLIAVGTDLAAIIVSSGYTAIRHAQSGNVVILASFIMIFGAAIGAQIGALATQYVTGPAIRLVLTVSVAFGALGAAAKLADVLTSESLVILDLLSKLVTFGGMAILVTVICGLVLTAVAQRRGREVPSWAESLVVAG